VEHADTAQIGFYLQRATASGGPALELGCGTGVITLALALAGIEMEAFDASAALVAQAQERRRAHGVPSSQCRIARSDLRALRLTRRFGFVFAPANALLTVGGHEDLAALLTTALVHLEPGGTFACDVRVQPEPSLADDRSGLELRALRWRRPHLLVRSEEGQSRIAHRLDVTGLSSGEIRAALTSCGLQLTDCWADFDGAPFEPASERMVLVAAVL